MRLVSKLGVPREVIFFSSSLVQALRRECLDLVVVLGSILRKRFFGRMLAHTTYKSLAKRHHRRIRLPRVSNTIRTHTFHDLLPR
jgi:hypothetical protein